MKNITILLAALTIASSAYAKEVMPVAEVETEVAVETVSQSDMYLNLRFGVDLRARYDNLNLLNTKFNDKTHAIAGEVAFEGYKTLDDNFDLGLGLAYQFHADRDFKNNGNYQSSGVEFDSIPLYLTGKYNFNTNSNIKPYLKANLGYSFNFNSSDAKLKTSEKSELADTNINDGLYWALGGGLEYNNFTADLMYTVNEARTSLKDYDSGKTDNDYERIVLSAGYRFNL